MPITFAQPEPFDARLASQVGAARVNPYSYAELVNQGTRNILSGYEQAASIAAGRSINDANRATSADMQNADRFAAQADNRERFALARQGQQQENMRLGLEIEARADAINRQAQAQAWLRQQDMSTAEVAKLRQLQNAVGAVNADPNLHPEEKANLILQLRTGIDPMQQRMQAEEQKQLKKRNELLDLTAKAQSAAEADRQQIMTGNLGTLPKMMVGGRELSLAFTGKGYEVVGLDAIKLDMEIQAHKAEQEERLAQRQREQDAKLQQQIEKLKPEFDQVKAQKEAVSEALEAIAGAAAPGEEFTKVGNQGLTEEQYKYFQEIMKRKREEFGARDQAYREMVGQKTGVPQPPPDQPQVGGQPLPQGPAPATQVKPAKASIEDGYKAQVEQVKAQAGVTDRNKEIAVQLLDEMRSLVEGKGPVAAMRPEDQKRYFDLKRKYQAALTVVPERPVAGDSGYSFPSI